MATASMIGIMMNQSAAAGLMTRRVPGQRDGDHVSAIQELLPASPRKWKPGADRQPQIEQKKSYNPPPTTVSSAARPGSPHSHAAVMKPDSDTSAKLPLRPSGPVGHIQRVDDAQRGKDGDGCHDPDTKHGARWSLLPRSESTTPRIDHATPPRSGPGSAPGATVDKVVHDPPPSTTARQRATTSGLDTESPVRAATGRRRHRVKYRQAADQRIGP